MQSNKHLALVILIFLRNIFILSDPALKTNTTTTTTNHFVGKSLVEIGGFTYWFSDLKILEYGEGAPLSIGKFSSISHKVTIFLGNYHRSDWISTFPFGQIHQDFFEGQDIVGHPTTKGGVTIGNDVWIGRGVTIMSGVTIGDGAIVGACAVVAKNVEPYSVVVGNPARHIRYRFDQDVREGLLKLRWWDLEIYQIKELAHGLCACPDIEKINFWIEKYRRED